MNKQRECIIFKLNFIWQLLLSMFTEIFQWLLKSVIESHPSITPPPASHSMTFGRYLFNFSRRNRRETTGWEKSSCDCNQQEHLQQRQVINNKQTLLEEILNLREF